VPDISLETPGKVDAGVIQDPFVTGTENCGVLVLFGGVEKVLVGAELSCQCSSGVALSVRVGSIGISGMLLGLGLFVIKPSYACRSGPNT
jgi:hypothetical protein